MDGYRSYRDGREAGEPSRAHYGGGDPWLDADDDEWSDYLDNLEGDALPGKDGKPPKAKRGKLWWASRILAALLLVFMLLVGYLAVTAPLSKSLKPIAPPEITLLAADGTPIARNGAVVDEPVKIEDLPPHVVNAFLAIEDRRFYSHWGVDPRGIARAAWTGHGGGSTITQQLAKFTFLTPEQTITRKAREALIAFWMEAWLDKDDILARYLSNAYFGANMYGLRAASLHYFYRQPENLTPEQAAMLAGLVQAPSRLDPTKNYDGASRRMAVVVGALEDAGYIDAAEAARMKPPRLDVRTKQDLPTGTYFADWALPQARALTEANYAKTTLTTTLDSRMQAVARQAVASARLGGAQVALVAMRPNGEVVAMIGGKDYAQSSFNRVTQAKRQPGSTFKLFVYLAALRAGLSPDDLIDNTAIDYGTYRPKNAKENYSSSITLEDGFARSSNVAAVRLWEQVGDDAVIDMARDLGVKSNLPKGDPSLALGTSTMTLMELTAAYAGVAGNSFPVKPTAFAMQEKGWFEGLMDGKKGLSRGNHQDIETMLRAAVNRGTGRAAALAIPNFGKTGTTQNNRDALFVGYAGGLVVGVWVGNDDNTPLGNVTGGGTPARIWKQFMQGALGQAARPQVPSPRPDPSGPVEPLDIPDGMIEMGEGTQLTIEGEDGVTISTDTGNGPLDVRIGPDGVRLDDGAGGGLRGVIERGIEARQPGRQAPADPPSREPPAPPVREGARTEETVR